MVGSRGAKGYRARAHLPGLARCRYTRGPVELRAAPAGALRCEDCLRLVRELVGPPFPGTLAERALRARAR